MKNFTFFILTITLLAVILFFSYLGKDIPVIEDLAKIEFGGYLGRNSN